MEGTMAVITSWAADFAPKSWAYCAGQLLPVAQNQALFSLLGTTFGGDGRNTFALPDLRGRVPVGTGTTQQGRNYVQGEMSGMPSVTLHIGNLPQHLHSGNVSLALNANTADGGTGEPGGNYPGVQANGYSTSADVSMAPPNYDVVIGTAGGGQAYPSQAPYLAISYIICIYGIFPSRQ